MSELVASPSLIRNAPSNSVEDERAHPLLSIGFRPFFLVAALTAVIWVPLWLFMLEGARVGGHFSGIRLHSHEMIFGFTAAVIAGFLLTAGANWTKQRTTNRGSLLSLLLLWLAGRVLLLVPGSPPLLTALVDLAFLPALAIVLALPLIAAKSARNFQFLFMLMALSIANGLMHAEAQLGHLGWVQALPPAFGQTLALRIVTLMLVVMGGRVIPMFTRNGTGAQGITQKPWLDRLALGAFLLAAIFDFASSSALVSGAFWALAGGLHLARMASWGPRAAASVPLVWILHLGYAATAISMLLEGLAAWGLLPPSLAIHALTVGGIGGLTLGMMTRVSLGHSGRMLVAPRSITVAFGLLATALVVRVLGPLLLPSYISLSYIASGVSWTLAFGIFLAFGLPIWCTPRKAR